MITCTYCLPCLCLLFLSSLTVVLSVVSIGTVQGLLIWELTNALVFTGLRKMIYSCLQFIAMSGYRLAQQWGKAHGAKSRRNQEYTSRCPLLVNVLGMCLNLPTMNSVWQYMQSCQQGKLTCAWCLGIFYGPVVMQASSACVSDLSHSGLCIQSKHWY